MKKNDVKKHFTDNAKSWIQGGYASDPYSYPTGLHRARIVTKILAERSDTLNIADLGCGGGNVSITMAEMGHRVTGLDGSEEMIALAKAAADETPPEIRDRLHFVVGDLEDPQLEENSFDAVVCMGVIGYLASDEPLLNSALRLLKPGGLFIVSCRNRLFNMNSLTHRTIEEIESGTASQLIEEIQSYYQPLPIPESELFVENLAQLSERLNLDIAPTETTPSETTDQQAFKDVPNVIEARQHTPQHLRTLASQSGFRHKGDYGVNPHLIDPNLRRLLPPYIFNSLSECLYSFEHLPISLVYSSVFISVFEKN